MTNTTTETAGDHILSGGAVPSTTSPLEEPREAITNEALQGGNAAGETAVTASSPRDTTKDENSAETVRGPAVLEGSENLDATDIQGTDNAGQDTTSEKSSHDHQRLPDNQKGLEGKDSVAEERNMTESGEVPPTVHAGTARTATEPQQKEPETENLLGSGSKMDNGKNYAQVSKSDYKTPKFRKVGWVYNPISQSKFCPNSNSQPLFSKISFPVLLILVCNSHSQ